MSDQSFLCKCTFCLGKNVNGVLLNRNTYNRHRLRIQEYSVKDENLENEDILQQMEEDMPLDTKENMILNTEEDIPMQIEEDIYQQEDNLNLVNNDSDTESFNFDEEDGKYYNDDNDDNNDNDDDDDNDNDDDDDNDNDDDDDNDENDDNDDGGGKTTAPEKIIEGLKLLHLKSLYNFTESAYEDIMKIFTKNNLSLYKIKKYLKEITGLVPIF